MGVSAAGKSEQPGMVLLDEDDKIEPLRKIVDSVHEAGVPIIAQIAHGGKNGVGGKAFDVNKLSDAQLEEIVAQFIAAAIRAQ